MKKTVNLARIIVDFDCGNCPLQEIEKAIIEQRIHEFIEEVIGGRVVNMEIYS